MMQEAELRKSFRFSVEEWHRAALEGTDLPVRFRVVGHSMRPLIRRERDDVTVVPLHRAPEIGDIVLFFREHRNDYVLHRVFRVNGEMVQTFGDGCLAPDPWTHARNLWGVAVKIERGRASLDPNGSLCRLYARAWVGLWRVRRYLFLPGRAARKLGRIAKRLLKREKTG